MEGWGNDDWLIDKKRTLTKYRIDGKSDWKGEKCGESFIFSQYEGEITLKRANENAGGVKKWKRGKVKENKEVTKTYSFIRCRLCDFIGVDRSDLAQHNIGVYKVSLKVFLSIAKEIKMKKCF